MEGDYNMKKFIFYWLDGTVNVVEGTNVSDAFMRLGYGLGAINALNYYKEIK